MKLLPSLALACCVLLVCGLVGCDGAAPPLAPTAQPLAAFPVGGEVPATFVKSARRGGAPLSLTASDGTGLTLVSMSARAVVEDPLAYTELHLEFENPEDRVLEGTFSITLPESASISRFAMQLGDDWQEGEVVERQAARRAYEDFLHRKQDPALLENAAGNQFSARVFPIPAKGKKHLIVSYSEELSTSAPYVIPLQGLPKMARLDLEVFVGEGGARAGLAVKDEAPSGDFVVERQRLSGADGLRSGDLAVVRVRPALGDQPDVLGPTLLLVDTSASRALGFEQEVALTGELVRRLAASAGPATSLTVACFDQSVETVFEGPASGFGDAELAKIRERGALGASDLSGALRWASKKVEERGLTRAVLLTDGVVTAGTSDAGELAKQASVLGESGVLRLDAVMIGGIRDESVLRRVVGAGFSRMGVVADGDDGAEAVASRLGKSVASGVAVAVPGARWSWPSELSGVQAGDEVLVYAEVPEAEAVRVRLGDTELPTPKLVGVTPKLLERSLARAKIASLEARAATKEGEDARRSILDLSVKHRVLTPYTALLVLETEADYARFKIDRRSLADIVTVTDGRLATVDRPKIAERGDAPAPKPQRAEDDASAPASTGAPDARPDAASANEESARDEPAPMATGAPMASAGGPGTGSGQGFGSGSGRLGGSHRVRPPSVRMGATTVTGRLQPEIVQRIVRSSFGRFRLCYENGLRQNPNLTGRVSVQFVIGRDGAVSSATSQGSDLPDTSVIACVVRAFATLSFPEPEGGTVAVTYPILFAPGDGPDAPTPTSDGPAPVEPPAPKVEPYAGRFQVVMSKLADKDLPGARKEAIAWRAEAPADVMALIALGEVLEAAEDRPQAARAYGAILDLFPSRADLRRFAGGRLERIGDKESLALAADAFEKAVEQRPDHPSGHRMLAYALLRAGAHERGFEAIVAGAKRSYPAGRFRGVERILTEDVGLIAAAWAKAEPAKKATIVERAEKAGAKLPTTPSLRFVLTWETDANDVDFHIHDAAGGHAFYSQKDLPSGGALYEDVTTGYGPECFTIEKPKSDRQPWYRMQANYYSRGPMGYGMGKLEIIDHDGAGGLSFEERPFVVMADHAFVELGKVTR